MTSAVQPGATAFITGAAQGIGLGIAHALARRGVQLALVDVDAEQLEIARKELDDLTKVRTYHLDVRDRDAYARVADAVESDLGQISLLFNNAGVAGGGPLAEMDYPTWDFFLDINIKGVANGMQTVARRMMARGRGGYVVNTASGAGLVGMGAFLYGMTKFAVVGMSESLQEELRDHGIGISVLCPGPVDTNILRNTIAQQRSEDARMLTVAEDDVAETEQALAGGASPRAVGELVVDAVDAGRFYIHTDDMMADLVQARTAAILSAMPNNLCRQ